MDRYFNELGPKSAFDAGEPRHSTLITPSYDISNRS